MSTLTIEGREKGKILEKAAGILKKWALKMPRELVFVLDFGLGNFHQTGHIEYWVVNRKKRNYCGKFIFMFEGQTCPEHYHQEKDETFFVLKGRVKMVKAGKKTVLNQGDSLIMPVRTKHTFTALRNSLILEVSQASILEDNYFSDRRIRITDI